MPSTLKRNQWKVEVRGRQRRTHLFLDTFELSADCFFLFNLRALGQLPILSCIGGKNVIGAILKRQYENQLTQIKFLAWKNQNMVEMKVMLLYSIF